MARNFSEDGAAGAMTGKAAVTAASPGSMTPSIMNNFNMTGTPAESGSTMPIGIGDNAVGVGGYGGGGVTSDQSNPNEVGAIPTNDIYGGGGGYGGGGFAPMGGRDSGLGSPGGMSYPTPSWNFSQGGAIDEDMGGDPNATDPQGSMMGNRLQQSINQALSTVNNVLSYGRKLHGIGQGGGDEEAIQTADRMPTVPGDQSESGVARPQPMPGPLPPTQNPFGKRGADAGNQGDQQQVAGVMPGTPFSESQKPQPMPGPLPPASNPFGKRADNEEPTDDQQPSQEMAAIDTEEEMA